MNGDTRNTEAEGVRSVSLGDRYLVVEEADLQDVLHMRRGVRHAEVAQRVAHEHHVARGLHLLEVLRVPQGAVVLVVHVDQLAFESLQDAL